MLNFVMICCHSVTYMFFLIMHRDIGSSCDQVTFFIPSHPFDAIPINCRIFSKLICHSKWITIRNYFSENSAIALKCIKLREASVMTNTGEKDFMFHTFVNVSRLVPLISDVSNHFLSDGTSDCLPVWIPQRKKNTRFKNVFSSIELFVNEFI